MASKETYRTFSKLWLINYCTVIVIITLHLSYALASETKEEASQNVTAIETNSTLQTPMAEPLIRFRRQPPRTIIKHIIRPKRYKMKRVKRPKIKYSFAEPPPTYYSRKPIVIKKPTFDSSILEDFSHMNVESADFDLPPSSYEAQSMDLDLYKHYEPSIEGASYKEIHKPSLITYEEPVKEPTYTEVSKSPSYTYSVPEISFKETSKPSVTYTYTVEKTRKPHTKYGAPTEYVYSTGYDKPSDTKYTYSAPATKTVYHEVEKPQFNSHAKNEYSYIKPSKEISGIPATTYGVPGAHIPAAGLNDYNKYSLVEQKPSYVPTKTETYHFAEPPQPEPSVEITYSPSYEINIPSPHESSYSNGKYHVVPQRQPPQRHAPNGYEEPDYQEHSKYEEPPQQDHPSIHYHPTNDYENQAQDFYEDTPPSHQDVSGTNQPARYQPAPPRHHAIDEFPPSQNLPINANHKQPPYDYPKSSYEVPIYDPVPFEASNHQEREVYPPQINDPSNKQQKQPPNANQPSEPNPQADVSHSSDTGAQTNSQRPQSPINHSRRTRKRKRTRGTSTTVSTTKHILDVPELEEAFEKENRKKNFNSPEPDAHASQRFEDVKNKNINNDDYSKSPWNPMKIRTSPIMLMATPTSTPKTIHTLSTKNKRYHYKQQRSSSTSTSTTSTTTTTTTEMPTKVEIISIEKSNSKAFYDGVFSTPKIYNINLNRNRFRLQNTSSYSTPQTHSKSTNESQFSKRTTKNTFDTTIFKSPINDRDVYRNLPKNHKFI